MCPPQIVVPILPSKALKRQLPFRGDDGELKSGAESSRFYPRLGVFPRLTTSAGIFEEDFIEERRSGLEGFVNKVARRSI